jgi:hypothetical protein
MCLTTFGASFSASTTERRTTAPCRAHKWFERAERALANGDTVATPEPWEPPKDTVTLDVVLKVKEGIERGHKDGPWSPKLDTHARSVRHLLVGCGVKTAPTQAALLKQLILEGFETADFRDKRRMPAKGIRSPSGKPVAQWLDYAPEPAAGE